MKTDAHMTTPKNSASEPRQSNPLVSSDREQERVGAVRELIRYVRLLHMSVVKSPNYSVRHKAAAQKYSNFLQLLAR
jgi:hypothetical protein